MHEPLLCTELRMQGSDLSLPQICLHLLPPLPPAPEVGVCGHFPSCLQSGPTYTKWDRNSYAYGNLVVDGFPFVFFILMDFRESVLVSVLSL